MEAEGPEVDVGPSGSKRTTEGVPIISEGATDGSPIVYSTSFEKLNSPI